MNALSVLKTGNASSLSLELPDGLGFEEWLEIGRDLARGHKALNWWIGDWWAFGGHEYGARARIAAEGIFGKEFQTLANAGSVCRAFETSRRREHLSFTHHAEVAGLEPAKVDELLDRAVRDNWTVKDIRSEAAAVRSTATHASRSPGPADREEIEWSALVGAWNRSSVAVRSRFLGEVEGTSPIDG